MPPKKQTSLVVPADGLGLSPDQVIKLITDWVVPRLIDEFIAELNARHSTQPATAAQPVSETSTTT
jgi:hypothetical protein